MRRREPLSRREFLRVAASAGAVGAGVVLLGACAPDDSDGNPTSAPETVADPPTETTTIRLNKLGSLCTTPMYFAGQFLPAEGFTDVQYIKDANGDMGVQQIAAGEIDIGLVYAPLWALAADRGDPVVLLAGVHPTCFELFGNDSVQSLRDLKGKRIAVGKIDPTDLHYGFMATLLAYVGISLENEVEFVVAGFDPAVAQMKAGTIDAMIAFPPITTYMRANNIGHLVIDGILDAPWSQHLCCMAVANRDFMEKHPVAAKRGLRALLTAADVCAREPERAARYLIDTGYTEPFEATAYPQDYDSVLHTVMHMSYSAWRDFNPEDTMRFVALRLKEAGIVKSTPGELIARASDWRYLEQIKRELAV
ncbi:MAG: ABC transporter substrate-binding protein [Dehalococcoidia bacterium]